MLRQFATISGSQVLFMMEKVQGVQTNAIDGEYSPRDALKLMLAGTALYVVWDEAVGGFVVSRQRSAEQLAEVGRDRNRSHAISQNTPTPKDEANMKPNKTLLGWLKVLVVSAGLTNLPGHAQNAVPAAQPGAPTLQSTDLGNQEEVVNMSPFVVDATSGQNTYQADTTLAGSRVRTDLKDVASAISVVTSQFMKDTGATNNLTLLQYTPNTEVSGPYGNYAGVAGVFVAGPGERPLNNPGTNNRVRGLDSADQTRDYFLTDIPWDSFNVDRVDLQRGPNSILFGIGSPAGIINASVNTAAFNEAYTLENRVGSYGSLRNSLDFNHVLLDQELAIRVAVLDDDTKYQQDPAFDHDKRIYGAVKWDPKFLKTKSSTTSLRANFEHGVVTANRPHVLPPGDGITPFFDASTFNHTTYDPYYAWEAGIMPSGSGGTVTQPGQHLNPYLEQAGGNAQLQYSGTNAVIFGSAYGPGGSGGPGSPAAYGIGPDGGIISSIGGFPFATPIGVGGYNHYSIISNAYHPNNPAFQGANSGFYKDVPLTDPSIFDFYNHMLEGPTNEQGQDWTAFNLALEQTFLHDRLGLQVVYDHQKYHDFSESTFENYLTFDAMANTMNQPWPYSTSVTEYNGTGTPGTNPNAGRAEVVSYGGNDGTGNAVYNTRSALRITGFGELRATDFLKPSVLADLLGRHLFNGLYSDDTLMSENRTWDRFAMDENFAAVDGNTNPDLHHGERYLNLFSYLSAPLFSATSAHGLNIAPLTTNPSPQGPVTVSYFDSHWKWSLNPSDPTYVNPAAPWTNPAIVAGVANTASTQSANPANYVGWTTGTFNVLNADKGDINSLYTSGNKVKSETTSKGLTWQGFLWDDTIVATYGWRQDTEKSRFGYGTVSNVTGAVGMDYGLDPLDPISGVSTGDSRTWGIVLHEPKILRGKLPLGTEISLTYSHGQNSRVESRYGLDGNPLPNAGGLTKDYGVVINTLNNKLMLKATWYDTAVSNANLTSVGDTGLGGNAYYAILLDGWTTGGALQDLAGIAGAAPGWEYFWDWTANDHKTGPSDPSSAAYQNDPVTLHEKQAALAWLNNPPPATWSKNFGVPIVNMTAVNAGDWAHVTTNGTYNPLTDGQWAYTPTKGPATTATVNDVSKGLELEVVGQLTKNWNISLNASKQKAYQTSLGAEFVSFITAQYQRYQGVGGDLRLWSAGDQTVRDYYNQNVWAAFQFQLQTNGKMVSEMAPWRCNLVTSYVFDHGFLKDVNVGLGYRYQEGEILGYALNDAKDNLDVNRPYWGSSLEFVDCWAGYGRKLTKKVNWHIQLNIHSIGDRARLTPISVQPDGSPAGERILEGQTWELTNTLSF